MISVSSFTSSCLFFWCSLCLSLLTQVEFFMGLQMHLSDLLSRCDSSFLYLLVSFLLKKKKTFNISFRIGFSSVQFSSVTQSCPTLCNPMNCSTPGLPVHHQLPEFTQTHVHRVSDAIQPSHPLSSPSPPAPNPSQHQSLFQ